MFINFFGLINSTRRCVFRLLTSEAIRTVGVPKVTGLIKMQSNEIFLQLPSFTQYNLALIIYKS